MKRTIIIGWLAIACGIAADSPLLAANYTLEIIQPQPGLSTNNRYYKAYPGILYKVPIGVFGGAYPFTYSLTTAPSGMTIDAATGIISWPNPTTTGSPHAVTVRVMDAEGTAVTRSWTITVTTAGFLFLDAVNGTHAQGFGCASACGTGTIGNPFRSMIDIYRGTDHASADDGTYADQFLYFRNGTYGLEGFYNNTDDPQGMHLEWNGGSKPVVLLEYPGETVVIDHNLAPGSMQADLPPGSNGAFIDMFRNGNADNTFIHGIRFQDMRNHAFRIGRNRVVFFENEFFNMGPGVDSANTAFIMFAGRELNTSSHMFVRDNHFSGYQGGTGSYIKTYGLTSSVIENNTFINTTPANGVDVEGLALKHADTFVDVRANTFDGTFTAGSINGNWNQDGDIEIRFNNIKNAPTTFTGGGDGMLMNHDAFLIGPYHIYRNTIEGNVLLRYLDADDGNIYFSSNVIVNENSGTPAGSHINHYQVVNPSLFHSANNLVGNAANNILDANGNLTAAYASFIGTRGHQLAPPPPPMTPLFEIPHHVTPYGMYWDMRASSAVITEQPRRGPKAPGNLWNFSHNNSGGFNNGPFMRYHWWDWDVSGVGHGSDQAGWFSVSGTNFRPAGGWPGGPYYARFRMRINAPLIPKTGTAQCDDTQMKFLILNSSFVEGTDRAIVMLHAGSEGGGNDQTQTWIQVRAGVSGSYAATLIPNGQWVNVQVGLRGGPEGTAFQRIYINNNSVNAPNAENLEFNDLTNTNQVWGFGNALDSEVFWGDITNTGSCVSEDAEIDVMEMQFDDQFDPFWNAGGTPPPPADTTAPSVPSGLSASTLSSTDIQLSWTASSDVVGVAGYRIYRGGVQISTSAGTSFISGGLTASTAYTYRVAAYDAAGNVSAQSTPVSATTLVAGAKILFVSTTGNDSVNRANNSVTTPWRTIGRAAWGSTSRDATDLDEAAQPGDIVSIAAGTYASSLAFHDPLHGRWEILYNSTKNGTEAAPITFRAEGVVAIHASSWNGPVIGAVGRNYIHWMGPFLLDEANILTVPDTGPAVLAGGSTGSGIDGATIHGNGAPWADNHNGVRLETCGGCFVRNTTIDNFYSSQSPDGTSHNGSAITIYGSTDTVIENNSLSGCGAGIYMKGTHPLYGHYPQANITARFNRISNMSSIGILIYNNAHGRIYQNIITDSPSGIGFYEETGIQFVNNTLHNVGSAVHIIALNNVGLVIQNQIATNVENGWYSDGANTIGGLTSNRNVWYAVNDDYATFGAIHYTLPQWRTTFGQDANSITSNPLYVNAAGNDFHLQPGSPARTLGIDILDLDNDGSTTDVIPAGAYITGNEVIGVGSGSSGGGAPPPPPPSGLPVPTLSLPSTLPINADIQIANAGSYSGATFTWNVNPVVGASGSGRSAVLGVPRPILATSSMPRLSLATMNLSPGPHIITVQASIGSQVSGVATANVNLVQLAQANLEAVRVYPNPWRSDRHAIPAIIFDNLTAYTTIKIFTMAGHHVKSLPTSNTSAEWDLTNERGDRVASGLYLYVMKADDGSKKTGKIVVIK